MDFLKKYYEKIILAVALVALIVSAVVLALRVNQLSNEEPTTTASNTEFLCASYLVQFDLAGISSRSASREAARAAYFKEIFSPVRVGAPQ